LWGTKIAAMRLITVSSRRQYSQWHEIREPYSSVFSCMGGRPWKIHHCNMRSFCMLLQQSSGPSTNEGIFTNHRSTSDSVLVSPVCLSRACVDGIDLCTSIITTIVWQTHCLYEQG
jgi:hypothetical protein